MKKFITLFVVFFSLFFSLQANDLTDRQLQGNVKSITSKYFTVETKFGELVRTLNSINIYEFDLKGNIITNKCFKPDGTLNILYQYSYNESNYLTKSVMSFVDVDIDSTTTFIKKDGTNQYVGTAYNSKGELESKTIHVYDNEGILLSKTNYNKDGTVNFFIQYNSQGIRIEMKILHFFAPSKSTYNDKGYLIKKEGYDSAGAIDEKTLYVCDDNGNCIEEKVFDANGALIEKNITVYNYDTIGNYTKSIANHEVTKYGETYLEPYAEYLQEFTYY